MRCADATHIWDARSAVHVSSLPRSGLACGWRETRGVTHLSLGYTNRAVTWQSSNSLSLLYT